jgi:hypothetical protein
METSSGVTFREYQLDIIEQGTAILQASGFLYLAMEVRTGKTLTSLGIARNIDAKNVLFITKKKAINSPLGTGCKNSLPKLNCRNLQSFTGLHLRQNLLIHCLCPISVSETMHQGKVAGNALAVLAQWSQLTMAK